MQHWTNRLRRWARLSLGAAALACGTAQASPTLTVAATTAGFSLSEFASGFPVLSGVGPLGIAFVNGGGVMVSDYSGNVRIFATDTDGQTAASAPVAQNYGGGNGVGLARLGNFVYMTEQSAGRVVRLNQNGTFDSVVVTGIPTATGIYAHPVNGKLYVSDCCSNTGIYVVDPITNTKTIFKASGNYDGLSISADGATIYAEFNQHIIGYRLSDGVQVRLRLRQRRRWHRTRRRHAGGRDLRQHQLRRVVGGRSGEPQQQDPARHGRQPRRLRHRRPERHAALHADRQHLAPEPGRRRLGKATPAIAATARRAAQRPA